MNLDYRSFHLNLLSHAYNNLLRTEPFNMADIAPQDEEFLAQMNQLIDMGQNHDENFFEFGQQLLCKLVRAYPEHVPYVSRDLFWFLGGECLHYMPDEEIEQFQQLDELRFAAEDSGEDFNYEKERARILKLH